MLKPSANTEGRPAAASSSIAVPSAATVPARVPGRRVTKRVRWWIVWTLFLSTVINYINRQTLSVLAPAITREFHMSHTALGRVFFAFQVSYALTWLVGGILLDWVGARLGLALAVAWWSLVSVLTGLAHSVQSFEVFRFLLGMGEGCNWPGASKVVSEWFPAQERGLAVAIFDSGSSVGGALASLVIPWIALAWGWRWAFALSGILGFGWLFIWLRTYYPVTQHPRLSLEEKEWVEAGRAAPGMPVRSERWSWRGLLADRNTWGIVIGKALTDPIWWFYVFWLPQYLSDARGFNLRQIAAFAWIPFIAADIGNFTGGFVSGRLIRRGMPVIRARKWVCVLSSLPILAGIPAARVHSPLMALGLISLAVWAYASWSTMGLTFPSDLFPPEKVASVTGLSGFAAGLVSALFMLAVGRIVDSFSYFPAFAGAGILPLLATVAVLTLIRGEGRA
ncbi:MAG TPA: MFS transporter [Terriglobia bacterium]|nr:MFS transporter [Terriglobia bacterium]